MRKTENNDLDTTQIEDNRDFLLTSFILAGLGLQARDRRKFGGERRSEIFEKYLLAEYNFDFKIEISLKLLKNIFKLFYTS